MSWVKYAAQTLCTILGNGIFHRKVPHDLYCEPSRALLIDLSISLLIDLSIVIAGRFSSDSANNIYHETALDVRERETVK